MAEPNPFDQNDPFYNRPSPAPGQRIWKVDLRAPDASKPHVLKGSLPNGIRPLSVGFDGDHFIVWALVDVSAPIIEYTFFAVPTGMDMTDVPLGTCLGRVELDVLMQHHEGQHQNPLKKRLVFHVFCDGQAETLTVKRLMDAARQAGYDSVQP